MPPALYWTAPVILSLYASGRTTGIVLDVREGVTHAMPVYEGLALQHSVTCSHVAGRAVTLARGWIALDDDSRSGLLAIHETRCLIRHVNAR